MKIQVTENFHWNDSDVNHLKISLLKQALVELNDKRRTKAMHDDARNWLFEENPDNPFSSRSCAIAGGYDIDKLRQNLHFILRH